VNKTEIPCAMGEHQCILNKDMIVCVMVYEGRSDLVLFRIKLKYYLFLIVARLRTRHAQYDFLSYKYFVHFSY